MFHKTTPNKQVTLRRTLKSLTLGVLSMAAVLGGFAQYPQTATAAVTNNTVNFQARLEGAGGSIVADGFYNVQFKLYSVDTAGTALWTESYFDTDGVIVGNDFRIKVVNGYLTANLGSRTAFPNTINWDQDLYITMNIGGVAQTATPTYDGEMNPRLRLTGVPYAFRAGQLAQFNQTTGFTSTLSLLQPTVGNQAFQLADQGAAGTYTLCVQGSTAGCTAAAGSSNYIQNGITQQASSNFNISGTGIVAILQAGSIDTAAAGTLTVGGTNATAISLADDVTVAAAKSITLIGGITSTRPASPTEGMLYYDQTTKQLLVYANAKWQADRSNSTVILGTSAVGGTSGATASKGADGADFVNTSDTSAQTVINAAIAALPATGGSVYLMEGTYIVDGPISLPSNTTLMGAGSGTVIKLKNAHNLSINVITNGDLTNGNSNITVTNLGIDGNKANNTAGTQNGIYFLKVGSGTGSAALKGTTIANITSEKFRNTSIQLDTSSNSFVTGNQTKGATTSGIYLNAVSRTSITSNVSQGNATGIWSDGGTGNTITGNITENNTTYGINLNSSSNGNTVVGNTTQGNGRGITINNSSSNNTVSGNTVGNNSASGIYFFSSSNNNIVTNNKFYNNGGTTGNNGVVIDASDANTITNNDITDTSCTTDCYAINIGNSTSDNNYLADNRHSGTAANPSTIQDLGTNTIYANQLDGTGNLINRNQGALTVGTTTASKTLTLQGSLSAGQLPTPAAPTLTTSGTAGAVTRAYAVTALDGSGETLASTPTSITTSNTTLDATNNVNINWVQVGGAVQYKIYRTTGAGTNATTTGLIGTVSANVFTFKDTGFVASGTTPAANTTGNATVAGNIQGGSLNITGNSTLGGTLAVTGTSSFTGAVTLGTASTTTGQLKFNNSTSAFTATIQSAAFVQNSVLTIPAAGATDTFCLQTLANCGSGGGVSTVGALDGGTANATGATITTNTIFLQSASSTNPGLVNTTAQTFGGAKTFNGNVGIGTNASTAPLSVASAAASTTTISLSNTNATAQVAEFAASNTLGYASFGVSNNGNGSVYLQKGLEFTTDGDLSTGGSSSIKFKVGGFNASNERMRISANGNVGIGLGDVDATARLQVGGANSTTALLVQNAAGTGVLSVDTTVGTTTLRGTTAASDAAVEGAELVTSQDFSNATFWTCTGWATTTTSATHTTGNTTACSSTASNFAVVAGATYQVSFTLAGNSNSTNTVTPSIGGVSSQALGQTGTNTQTIVITGTSTAALSFTPTTNFNGTISSVSVKLITKSTSVLTVLTSTGTANLEVRTSGINNLFIGLRSGQSNTTGTNNTAAGAQSLQNNTTGFNNTATGSQSLRNNTTGTNNTATGNSSLQNNTTGNQNTATGTASLQSNTTGFQNTATGFSSLLNNTTGNNNTAAGRDSLRDNTTGFQNTATGSQSLRNNTTGTNNTATGTNSLRNLKTLTGTISATVSNAGNAQFTSTDTTGLVAGASITISGTTSYNGARTVLSVDSATSFTISTAFSTADTTGSWTTAITNNNTAFGYNAGQGSLSGYSAVGNSLFGYQTGNALQTGADYNSLFGFNAGSAITTGKNNTILGYNAGTTLTSGSNNILIGQGVNAASDTGSDQLNIGGLITGVLTAGSQSLTVNGAATLTSTLAVTGAPTASASASLVRIGAAIAGGNAAVNGGTYIGLNAPATGAGSTADFLNFQLNGAVKLKLDNAGSTTQAGTMTVQGSGASSIAGTLNIGGAAAVEKFAVGGAIALQETTAPTGTAGYGKLYVNSTDKQLHFISSTGSDLVLGAKTKKIVLTAEYAGAVLDAANDASCSSANAGSMTSGFAGTASLHSFYKWTTTSATAQCYDVIVRVPIPSDYASWAAAPTVTAYSSDGAAAINVETRDTSGTLDANNYAAQTLGTATWTTSNLAGLTSANYTAGGTMTMRIRMTSTNNNFVQVGNIVLTYNTNY